MWYLYVHCSWRIWRNHDALFYSIIAWERFFCSWTKRIRIMIWILFIYLFYPALIQNSVWVDIWIELCLRCVYWTRSRWHNRELEWDVYLAGRMSLLRNSSIDVLLRLFFLFLFLSFCLWRSKPVSLLMISPSACLWQANPNRGLWYNTVSDDVIQCDMNIILNMCTCKTSSPPPGAPSLFSKPNMCCAEQ